MEHQNPYAMNQAVVAAQAPATERAAFLQRTYSLLLAVVLVFAATLWAAGNVAAVNKLAVGLWQTSPWIVLIGIIGAGYAVRAVADRHPINIVAYFAYTVLFGLLLAPLVLVAAQAEVLTEAALTTAIVFTGLTGYVFWSKKDFSFLGGILSIAMFGMLAIIVGGLIFGFQAGLWFSVLGVIVFSGFILYDTSRILHHMPTTMHVRAAIELFVSLIMLLQYVIILLLNSRD